MDAMAVTFGCDEHVNAISSGSCGRRCPLSPFCPTVCRCGGAACSLCCAWRAPLEEHRTGGRPQRPRGGKLCDAGELERRNEEAGYTAPLRDHCER
eukprot:Transcript_25246.p3 GENE.Transcript_25246~~Transcript_25246.p3  ORF type:complete len:96 (-),score=4.26 Transcript_25246:166-453(-)